MKKIIPLSLVAVLSLSATEIELAPIGVESTLITEVAQNAQVSADVAEALSNSIPSIDINRRSGIANDVHIRGQKRDNISVEVDGTKVHGACPNRMDPPISHILTNQIESIEVTEGPYDVTTFGTMSGGLKITTKKPSKEFKGEINAGVGSWGYKKVGATFSGGNDTIRVLLTGSTESSGQYEDGDGNTLSQQIANNQKAVDDNLTLQSQYSNMDAYSKKSINTKIFVNLTDNQELRLSYTGNRSDNILYPNSGMDAVYDDSNIYSIEYNIANLTNSYKNVNLQYYYSDVDHPMSTEYREKATNNMMNMTSQLTTEVQGLKLKNNFNFDSIDLLVGLDGSTRNWNGIYFNNVTGMLLSGAMSPVSINDSDTKNVAAFAKVKKTYSDFDVEVGARYDATKITSADTAQQDNDYKALSLNLLANYKLNPASSVFFGIGQASRVPDARELYFISSKSMSIGTNNLKDTTNKEIDVGYTLSNENMKFKVKAFYSDLSDYIYFKKGVMASAFQNIDAKVYGTEIDSEYFVSDNMTINASLAYKRGKKDQALAGQTDTNLADIAPLRGTLGVTYEYMNNSSVSAQILASDKWDNYDSDNGEQKIAGWSVVNLKAKHAFGNTIDLTFGVNNLFDATYAQSNTYADLTLLSTGSDVMLLNEPGRYLYTNLTYKF